MNKMFWYLVKYLHSYWFIDSFTKTKTKNIIQSGSLFMKALLEVGLFIFIEILRKLFSNKSAQIKNTPNVR